MMWLLPSAIGIGAVAALAVLALHFISRSRPLAEPLPTARFVPLRPVNARARSIALSDLVLLALRIAAVLALAAGVAAPVFSAKGRTARVMLLDRSRAVGNIAEVRDSARALRSAGTIAIPFDSAIGSSAMNPGFDSLRASGARGSLSAALAAAQRAAVALAASADSVELVLVSPVVEEEIDAATTRLRAAWPGRIRLVRVGTAAVAPWQPRVDVRAAENDAVAAGVALMGAAGRDGSVRLVRSRPTSADTSWARTSGHVLLLWPASASDADWPRRDVIDAIGGVASVTGTLIARFPRPWTLHGVSVARWADGEPAVVERAMGEGCIREVSVLLDQASDITLRTPFRRFAEALLAPCGGQRNGQPVALAALASMAGGGALATAGKLRDTGAESSRWTPWLLLIGALLLIIELAVRRSQSRSQSRVA
jgi:hypothetical protein